MYVYDKFELLLSIGVDVLKLLDIKTTTDYVSIFFSNISQQRTNQQEII